jgi:hypothetical protein
LPLSCLSRQKIESGSNFAGHRSFRAKVLIKEFSRLLGEKMKRAVTFALAITLVFSSLSPLYILTAYPEAQVGIKSGDWVKYAVVTEERNWTGWQRFDIYDVEAGLIKFNATTYSDSLGYTYTSGQYNLSDIGTYVVFPDDIIKTIVIPRNLKTGDTLLHYGMGPMIIDGETSGTYLGAIREVIYATYTPPSGTPSEASKIDYKWDKITGIALEYTALYPDGKTTIGKIADTNIWQPQAESSPYLLYSAIIAAVTIVLVVTLLVLRIRKKKSVSNKAKA